MGTVEMLTLENMGIAFGILSLGGTEPEIHLGVIYPPIATYVLKNTIATLGLKILLLLLLYPNGISMESAVRQKFTASILLTYLLTYQRTDGPIL